jgi:hypothetical protein
MREMKQKVKSKTKILQKKQLRKKDLLFKSKKRKSRRRSLAPQDKFKSITDHSKRKENVRKYHKYKWECMSDSSDDSHERDQSYSSSPRYKKAHFKRLNLDSLMKCDLVDKNKTVQKEDYFKSEFKKAHAEILDMKGKLNKTKAALDIKNKENDEIIGQVQTCKKKLKHLKYYKEKTRDYKVKLKQASKEMQELEIENNRKSAQCYFNRYSTYL